MKKLGVPDEVVQRMDGKDRNDCPFCEEKLEPLLRHLQKHHTSKKNPEFQALHVYAKAISQTRKKK